MRRVVDSNTRGIKISSSGEDHKNGVNIYDISQAAGVSIATVSRVLNDSAKVSEKTREKVLKTMDRLGYRPNAFARGLGLGSMDTIGIMVTDASDPYLASGVYYAEQALKQHGYSTILACSGYELEDKQNSMELLCSKQIDGVLMIGSSFIEDREADRDYILEASRQVPVVIANGYMNGDNIYCVTNNEFESVFGVTEALLEHGRKNVLYVYGAKTYSGIQKLNGFRAALGARGVQVQEDQLLYVKKDPEDVRKELHAAYARGIRFDAVVTSEDVCAVGVVKFAADMDMKIPEDLEIVGYNNSILSRCTVPELTSIDNHVRKMSEKAVEQMILALSKESKVEHRVVIPCDIVKRGSTQF